MVNFNDFAANVHIGYKVAIGIIFAALVAWVGRSIYKLVVNLVFNPKPKEEKIEA